MTQFGNFQIAPLLRFFNHESGERSGDLFVFWIGLTVLILLGDYFSGPIIQFPIFYLLPVSLAAWCHGLRWGLFLAVSLPVVRFGFLTLIWNAPWSVGESLVNTAIRMIVLGIVAWFVHLSARQTRQLAQRVRVLEGILPVCSFCKKIRDHQGQWQSMEQYITERSEARFSHGFCPECGQSHYGHLLSPAIRTPADHPEQA